MLAVDAAFCADRGGRGQGVRRPSGSGSWAELFAAATADEQYFLVRLLSGELRQGALDGVMTDAVAKAAEVPAAEVRRAVMLSGSLRGGRAGRAGRRERGPGRVRAQVGRPLQPMLASSEASIDEALARIGGAAAVEWKLDGIRVQVARRGRRRAAVHPVARRHHRPAARGRGGAGRAPGAGRRLRRRADRAAAGRAALRLPGHRVAGGERGSTRTAAGRPRCRCPRCSFRRAAPGRRRPDRPARRRAARCARPPSSRTRCSCRGWSPRIRPQADGILRATPSPGATKAWWSSRSTTPYAAGRRGAGWIKVKPRHTLDLVVLAVEWGHGRRQGWLSNLHLGARDPETGGWVMLGKTFKGLTDEHADLADRSASSSSRTAATTGPSTSAPSRWSRSPSTACSAPRATRAAWPCGSPGCCATGEDKPAAEADTIDTRNRAVPRPRLTCTAVLYGATPRRTDRRSRCYW